MEALQNVAEIVDDIKVKLSDQEYLSLMDTLKEIHNTQLEAEKKELMWRFRRDFATAMFARDEPSCCDFCENPRFRLTKRVGDSKCPEYDEWTCQKCYSEQYEDE